MTSHPPLISVVIPSFNQAQFLEKNLLSVIGQQYPNLEILVLDGGSTDGSVDIIRRYEQHLTYWRSQKDKGQADAINQGFSMARGDIFCWLNSDDLLMPGTLLRIGQQLSSCIHEPQLIYGDTVVLNLIKEKPRSSMMQAEPFNAERLTYYDFVIQPSAFWTRPVWEKTGPLEIRYNYVLDWDWFIRASRQARFTYLPELFSMVHFHGVQKTTSGGDARRAEILEIVSRYASDYWQTLYRHAIPSFEALRRKRKYLYSSRLPHWPNRLRYRNQLRSVLQNARTEKHLSDVLTMLGA